MRVPDQYKKCVVFLFYKDKGSGDLKIAGTAFFLAIEIVELGLENKTQISDLSAVYTVTAKHVIEGIRNKSIDKKVYIRVNPKGGEAVFKVFDIDEWVSHPDDPSIDITLTPIGFDPKQYDSLWITYKDIIQDNTLEQKWARCWR